MRHAATVLALAGLLTAGWAGAAELPRMPDHYELLKRDLSTGDALYRAELDLRRLEPAGGTLILGHPNSVLSFFLNDQGSWPDPVAHDGIYSTAIWASEHEQCRRDLDDWLLKGALLAPDSGIGPEMLPNTYYPSLIMGTYCSSIQIGCFLSWCFNTGCDLDDIPGYTAFMSQCMEQFGCPYL